MHPDELYCSLRCLFVWVPYRWIRISQQVSQHVYKTLALDQHTVVHVQLGDTCSSCLSNIGILIPQTVSQWVYQDIDNLLHLNIAHCTDSKSTNKWIVVLYILQLL